MLDEFSNYIEKNELIAKDSTTLLAISAGVDSVVMAYLFKELGLSFSIAHCNFCLRKNEADKDQKFVEDLAKELNVEFHIKAFDTTQFAEEKGYSIQMAARELRYDWFREVIEVNRYGSVAVATHIDDAIETFIINATRGTGISGLRGILPKNKKVIRPLLFASKSKIENFARRNKITYRQDTSNSSDKYMRNKIRHHVVPVLKEINPSLETTFKQNFANLSVVEHTYFNTIDSLKKELISKTKEDTRIDFVALKKTLFPAHYLYEFINQLKFTFSDCSDIIGAETGKVFRTRDFILNVNRGELIIEKKEDKEVQLVFIEESITEIQQPISLGFATINCPDSFLSSQQTALLDKEKMLFPLCVRQWRSGDYFYPLGMSNKKKVSDFLIDIKLSLLEKESTFVLTSGEDIVWVIGQRIDNRYKITEVTRKVFQVKLIDKES